MTEEGARPGSAAAVALVAECEVDVHAVGTLPVAWRAAGAASARRHGRAHKVKRRLLERLLLLLRWLLLLLRLRLLRLVLRLVLVLRLEAVLLCLVPALSAQGPRGARLVAPGWATDPLHPLAPLHPLHPLPPLHPLGVGRGLPALGVGGRLTLSLGVGRRLRHRCGSEAIRLGVRHRMLCIPSHVHGGVTSGVWVVDRRGVRQLRRSALVRHHALVRLARHALVRGLVRRHRTRGRRVAQLHPPGAMALLPLAWREGLPREGRQLLVRVPRWRDCPQLMAVRRDVRARVGACRTHGGLIVVGCGTLLRGEGGEG